jgi:DNA polymerase III delta subunit
MLLCWWNRLVKIENKNIGETMARLPEESPWRAALLYGTENSLLQQRQRYLLNIFKAHNYEVIHWTADDIKGQENILAEELVAVSLFASRRLLLLSSCGSSFGKSIVHLVEGLKPQSAGNFLLLVASLLETTSPLRRCAEKSAVVACIPCYEETSRELAIWLRESLRSKGFNFSPAVIDVILASGDNRSLLENELQKLLLYKGMDRNLTDEDVRQCFGDTTTVVMEDFLDSCCRRDAQKTLRILEKIQENSGDFMIPLRALVRHLLLLRCLRCHCDSGENLEQAFTVEKVFWKTQMAIRQYWDQWSRKQLDLLLNKLLLLEKSIKFSSCSFLRWENFLLRYFLGRGKKY